MLDSSINVRRSIYRALRVNGYSPEKGFLSPRYSREAQKISRYLKESRRGGRVIITNTVYWETVRVIDNKIIGPWVKAGKISNMASRRLMMHVR